LSLPRVGRLALYTRGKGGGRLSSAYRLRRMARRLICRRVFRRSPGEFAGAWRTATRGPMTRTDEELVASATAGDLESFNQLVSRWERPIYALAYRTLGREEDARDVVQDAFLRAFRGLKGFKGEAKFSSWLYRITLNLCRDWIRKERRAPIVQVPEGVDPVDLADEQASPVESVEDLVARREMSQAVARAMGELPDE